MIQKRTTEVKVHSPKEPLFLSLHKDLSSILCVGLVVCDLFSPKDLPDFNSILKKFLTGASLRFTSKESHLQMQETGTDP